MEIAGERAAKLSRNRNSLFATMEFGAIRFLDGSVRRIPFRTYPVGVEAFVEGFHPLHRRMLSGRGVPGPAMIEGGLCRCGRHDGRGC
jgi:hypothetical protein